MRPERRSNTSQPRVVRAASKAVRGRRAHPFVALCEDAAVLAEETHDREAARTRVFDSAQTLAPAHTPPSGSASGELAAAALDAGRRVADKIDATRADRSKTP